MSALPIQVMRLTFAQVSTLTSNINFESDTCIIAQCGGSAKNCNTGAGEQEGPGPFSKRDALPSPTPAAQLPMVGKFYRLASGREILLQKESSPGEKVYRLVPINATLYEEQMSRQGYEDTDLWERDNDSDTLSDIDDNLELEEDTIVAEAVAACSISLPPPSGSSSFFFSSSSSFVPSSSSGCCSLSSVVVSASVSSALPRQSSVVVVSASSSFVA